MQIVGGIVEQLIEKAKELIAGIFGSGSEDADPDEAIAEVEAQVEEWAVDYSDMVAITEVTAAIEETVLDDALKQGDIEKYWNAEPDACPVCLENMAASPISITAAWPSGDQCPPAHPRCRCSSSTGNETRIARHLPGKHDQKNHGNRYSYGVDADTGKKTKTLIYKGGSGTKAKTTKTSKSKKLAGVATAAMEPGALKKSTDEFANLLDVNSNKEGAGKTKARIAGELAKRLEGNKDFEALVERMKVMHSEPDMTPERACDLLIRNWATTSGDHDTLAVAMQVAAKDAFNLNEAEMWYGSTLEKAAFSYGDVRPGMQAFINAQYSQTQAWFKAQGIKEVMLYRGAAWYNNDKLMPKDVSFDAKPTKISTSLQPLSSFSTDPKVSLNFASYHDNRLMVGARVPVSRILGTCQTGYGCKDEAEMVVIGKNDTMLSFSWKQGHVDEEDIYKNFAAASQSS